MSFTEIIEIANIYWMLVYANIFLNTLYLLTNFLKHFFKVVSIIITILQKRNWGTMWLVMGTMPSS